MISKLTDTEAAPIQNVVARWAMPRRDGRPGRADARVD
jgi:hypothetical protein